MAVKNPAYLNGVKIIISAAAAFILLIHVFPVTAYDFPFAESAPQLKASDMQIWYDRSDLEESREMWLSSAATGMMFLSFEERDRALPEMKNRLASWQWKRIEEEITLPDIQSLLSEIENKKDKYLYLLEDGNPLFDDNGKPFFKGLSDLDSDTASWESELKTFISDLFTSWEKKAKLKFDEILSCEKNIDGDEKALLDVSFSEYKNSVKKEFEYFYLAGRKNLVTMRSKDSFSLKNESEEKGASGEAENRIDEIQTVLEDASESLKKNLSVMKSLNTEEAVLKINEWEDDFRESFEAGLEKWEKAEKDFLTERMRWEREGKEGYIEAEKEWDSAVEKFTDAKTGVVC